jgi:hypothetical protein
MAGSHGGVRAGAGRPRKSLVDRLFDGSFSTERHAHLLEHDDSLLALVVPEDHPDFAAIQVLRRFQVEYRRAGSDGHWRRWILKRMREELGLG